MFSLLLTPLGLHPISGKPDAQRRKTNNKPSKMMNLVKTGALLTIMTMLFMAVGYLLGGQAGMLLALLFAAGTNMFAWWNSGKMVLRMHNARAVDENSAPELVSMTSNLAERAGLPIPDIYVIETQQPNAFATGRNPENSAVAVSTGLLDQLHEQEVAAVIAHELAHIKNRDTLTMTVTATLAGAIGMLANFAFFFRGRHNNGLGMIATLATMLLAPIAATIVQMAISRAREYQADRLGAQICGNPLWLAAALDKIAKRAHGIVNQQAEAAPATAHLFIINPLNGQSLDNLFSTHPNTENRIVALQRLAQEWQQQPPKEDERQREIWGRNAGNMRSNETALKKGPWG